MRKKNVEKKHQVLTNDWFGTAPRLLVLTRRMLLLLCGDAGEYCQRCVVPRRGPPMSCSPPSVSAPLYYTKCTVCDIRIT